MPQAKRDTVPLALNTSKYVSIFAMQPRARYLIVDGHSVIFAWPELRKLHSRRSSLAREALIKQLRDYQDWTGVRVVVVFDGKGKKVEATSDPGNVHVGFDGSRDYTGVRRRMDFSRSVARAAVNGAAKLGHMLL